MLLEAVQLHTRVVVDKDMSLLSHSKHHFVVQVPSQSAMDPRDEGGGDITNEDIHVYDTMNKYISMEA